MHEHDLDDAIIEDDFVDITAYAKFMGFRGAVLVTRELWDQFIAFDDSEFIEQTNGSALERIFDVLFGIIEATKNTGELHISESLLYTVAIVTAADRTEDIPLECMLEVDDDESMTLVVALAEQNEKLMIQEAAC